MKLTKKKLIVLMGVIMVASIFYTKIPQLANKLNTPVIVEAYEESKSVFVSGVQMLSDAELYEEYKPISLYYKGTEYSLDNTDNICNTIKVPFNEIKRPKFIRSETEGKISFDCEQFNKRWEVVNNEDIRELNNKRFTPKLIFGNGSEFEYDDFNEIFLTNNKFNGSTNFLKTAHDGYVKFELRHSESFELKGFYLVPLDIIREDKVFDNLHDRLRE